MKVLVLGASGATGRLVVQQLLCRTLNAKIVVRYSEKIPHEIRDHPLVECREGNITEFDNEEFRALLSDCDAVISCLGHTISLKGIFGKPRLLVADTVRSVCDGIHLGTKNKVQFILMNTTANQDKNKREFYSFADRIVLSLLGVLLPPQRDNVRAAGHLLNVIGTADPKIEWTIVRPDTLIDDREESGYELHESPMQSPVFKPGKTSRINVSHFMAELLCDKGVWERWKFKMPVIYNSGR
jgi:hypothetical protein